MGDRVDAHPGERAKANRVRQLSGCIINIAGDESDRYRITPWSRLVRGIEKSRRVVYWRNIDSENLCGARIHTAVQSAAVILYFHRYRGTPVRVGCGNIRES